MADGGVVVVAGVAWGCCASLGCVLSECWEGHSFQAEVKVYSESALSMLGWVKVPPSPHA